MADEYLLKMTHESKTLLRKNWRQNLHFRRSRKNEKRLSRSVRSEKIWPEKVPVGHENGQQRQRQQPYLSLY